MSPLETNDARSLILELAKSFGITRFTAKDIAEIQIRVAGQLGGTGSVSAGEVEAVLREAGFRIAAAERPSTDDRYEEEFEDLLHFSTLPEAEMTLVRLDDLWRKFVREGDRPAAGRALEVARLGKRRAEMIARNSKVSPQKRAEKEEMVQWFRVWLETPDAFFDWLELRKQSPEFQARFGEQLEEL